MIREGLHHKRVDDFCEPHRRRARAGEAHPVWDFLFTYYSLRPRQLRIWHPGFGVALGGAVTAMVALEDLVEDLVGAVRDQTHRRG